MMKTAKWAFMVGCVLLMITFAIVHQFRSTDASDAGRPVARRIPRSPTLSIEGRFESGDLPRIFTLEDIKMDIAFFYSSSTKKTLHNYYLDTLSYLFLEHPHDPRLWWQRAYHLEKLGRDVEAGHSRAAAIASARREPKSNHLLPLYSYLDSELRARAGDPEGAAARFLEGLRTSPAAADGYLILRDGLQRSKSSIGPPGGRTDETFGSLKEFFNAYCHVDDYDRFDEMLAEVGNPDPVQCFKKLGFPDGLCAYHSTMNENIFCFLYGFDGVEERFVGPQSKEVAVTRGPGEFHLVVKNNKLTEIIKKKY